MTGDYFQLGCIFPQLRSWWEREGFYHGGDPHPRHTLEAIIAFYTEHRIAELLETIESVSEGRLPASALEKFHPRPAPTPRTGRWNEFKPQVKGESAVT